MDSLNNEAIKNVFHKRFRRAVANALVKATIFVEALISSFCGYNVVLRHRYKT
jgi:hypothetical protein